MIISKDGFVMGKTRCYVCDKVFSHADRNYLYFENNGRAYYIHSHCDGKRPVCSLTGLPIPNSSKYYTRDGLYFSSDAFDKANKCDVCGYPIIGEYIKIKDKGKVIQIHQKCYNNSDMCRVCNLPINNKLKKISINGIDYCYHQECYDNNEKCVLSKLPVFNMGPYTQNKRSKTLVLKKFIKTAKKCYSCGDYFKGGWTVKNIHLCSFCRADLADNKLESLLKTVQKQLSKNGISIPKNICISLDKPSDGISNEHNKGKCHTICRSDWRGKTYDHTISIRPFLHTNYGIIVIAHELSHAILTETLGKASTFNLVEGRCDFVAYTIAKQLKLPEYVIESIRQNDFDKYRTEFLEIEKKRVNLKQIFSKRIV